MPWGLIQDKSPARGRGAGITGPFQNSLPKPGFARHALPRVGRQRNVCPGPRVTLSPGRMGHASGAVAARYHPARCDGVPFGVLRHDAALAWGADSLVCWPRIALPADPRSSGWGGLHPKPKRRRAVALHKDATKMTAPNSVSGDASFTFNHLITCSLRGTTHLTKGPRWLTPQNPYPPSPAPAP